METAPNTSFPYFTPSSGGNSETFSEGPGGLLALPNPFTITRTEEWSVRILLIHYEHLNLQFLAHAGKDSVFH